tara:strand:+ start:188 stop:1648 length:1461 start_codon:yes stop_codon:yes gene_type:complete
MSYEHIKRRIVEHDNKFYAIDYRIWDEKNNTYKIIETDAEAKRGVKNNLVETIHIFDTKEQAQKFDERQNTSVQGFNNRLQDQYERIDNANISEYEKNAIKSSFMRGYKPVVLNKETIKNFATGNRPKFYDISIVNAVKDGLTVSVIDKDDSTANRAFGAAKAQVFKDTDTKGINIINTPSGGFMTYGGSGQGLLNEEMQYVTKDKEGKETGSNMADVRFDSTPANVFSFMKGMMFGKSYNLFKPESQRYTGYATGKTSQQYSDGVRALLPTAHALMYKNQTGAPKYTAPKPGSIPSNGYEVKLHLVAQLLYEADYTFKSGSSLDPKYKKDLEIQVLKAMPFINFIAGEVESYIEKVPGFEGGYASLSKANINDKNDLINDLRNKLDVPGSYQPRDTGFVPSFIKKQLNKRNYKEQKTIDTMANNPVESTNVDLVLAKQDKPPRKQRPTAMESSGTVPEDNTQQDVRPNLFNKFMESVGRMGVGKR